MTDWPDAIRPGFCLGCGADTDDVKVPADGYKHVPDVAHPAWCERDACQANRKQFNVVADRILEGT